MLETLFVGCAVFGGAVMVMQFLLTALGIGGGEAMDSVDLPETAGHHGALGLLQVLSFRTMIAGVTFFGLGGLAGIAAVNEFDLPLGLKPFLSVGLAVLLGLFAGYIVHYLYRWMYSLRYDGSVKSQTLLGANGSVYVRIPSAGAIGGKVLVNHQERTMEYEAITQGEELKAGTPIKVVRVVSERMVEVERG